MSPSKLSLCIAAALAVAAPTARAAPLPPPVSASRAQLVGSGLVGGDAGAEGAGLTPVPSLFTGAMVQRVPLDLPPGRRGVAPRLALTYRSDTGNGWLGVGWTLDLPTVERSLRYGVSYTGNDFVLRAEQASDLVGVGGVEYRAKIQGDFARLRRLVGVDGRDYWELTDTRGVRFFFGQTSASRQDDPANGAKILRWCLDRVEDPSGNYFVVTYFKHRGAIYPDTISYTGGGGVAPATTVRFWRDLGSRPDAAPSYAPGFEVVTAYRLQSVEVRVSGALQQIYGLDYRLSPSTGRSQLASVRRFGADGALSAAGVASGSALPPDSFGYSSGGPPASNSFAGPAVMATRSGPGVVNLDLSRLLYGDFNGDGRTDVAYVGGFAGPQPMKIHLATGGGFLAPLNGPVRQVGGSTAAALDDLGRVKLGDFNGDGKTDILTIDGPGTSAQISVYLADTQGSGTLPATPSFLGPRVSNGTLDVDVSRLLLGDFDGDGKTDFLYVGATQVAAPTQVFLSTGAGFRGPINGPSVTVTGLSSLARFKLGDFDGDGKTEIAHLTASGGSAPIAIYKLNATGTGVSFLMYGPTRAVRNDRIDEAGALVDVSCVMTGDVNGDGKTDFLVLERSAGWAPMSIYLSTGTGFTTRLNGPPRPFNNTYPDQSIGSVRLGDFNGDGRTDLAFIESSSGPIAMTIHLSLGNGFTAALQGPLRYSLGGSAGGQELLRVAAGDFDGDGRTDFIGNDANGAATPMTVYPALGLFPDLLTAVTNGIGGAVSLTYLPSTAYLNRQLPFAVQTLSSATTDDGNGIAATTRYTYENGFYYPAERDFRGFERVTVTGPAGPDGEQQRTHHWFHQGNDVAVDANNPGVPVGYTKGKPYRTQVWDLQRSTYVETLTSYWPSAGPSYFAPPSEVKVQRCEQVPPAAAPTCARAARTTYSSFDASGAPVSSYDVYGNALRENQFQDEADALDDRTIVRTYGPNPSAWIVSLPTSETIYAGAGAATSLTVANQLAQTRFAYDGALDLASCTSAGTTLPSRGNLTSTARWLKGGTDAVARSGYDAFGNEICSKDADGRIARYGYDGTFTFRTLLVNAKNHDTLTQYYGVDGLPADLGRYGQPKKVLDPNRAETSYEYDTFGRKVREVRPPVPAPASGAPYPGFTVTTSYYLGGVGTNRIETLTSAGEWVADHLDGLGRSYLKRKRGSAAASARTFATRTDFNATGTKRRTSLPYEDVAGAVPRWISFSYDAQGRVVSSTKQDGARTLSCYRDMEGSSVAVDANGHRRREVADVRGNRASMQEYLGSFASCTTDAGSPYATTRYGYDRMNRLTTVTDAAGNLWVTDYDTLGRKSFQSDPDLGTWYYGYSQAGDLLWQQDANGSSPLNPYKIYFQYDELHRLTRKNLPRTDLLAGDTFYRYDGDGESPPVPFAKGKVTRMTDASGETTYLYDAIGRNWRRTQTTGQPYATESGWDLAGRLSSEKYPDGTSATYAYDADGFLVNVSVGGATIAALGLYNPLGQVGSIAYGSAGVATRYLYNETGNNRIQSITTTRGTATLLRLSYGYDPVRNILSVADGVNPANGLIYRYDELDRLTSATSASLGALAYSYSAIGNILSKEGVSYTYHPIKAHAVTATSDGKTYDYDANGNMLSDGTRTLTYDYENRPKTIIRGTATATFAYDGDGKRVVKSGPSGTTVYVGRLYECQGTSCTRHVFAGDKRVASLSAAGTRFYHVDHLDSTRVVSDQNGAVVESISYRPYGDSTTGATKYRFTSKELDSETGLYFYGGRYYNQILARFITPDPVAPKFEDPQSLSRYSYVKNNPVFYVDPTGYRPTPATDPAFERRMMLANPFLYWAIVASNNYSPFAFEQNLKDGDLANLFVGSGSILRGLAGEAYVAERQTLRGFATGSFPKAWVTPPFDNRAPDLFMIGPPSRVLQGVVLDRSGATGNIVYPFPSKPATASLDEVKAQKAFEPNNADNGVEQVNVNATLVKRIPGAGTFVNTAARLFVDMSAWEGAHPSARAQAFSSLAPGAYIVPVPGLYESAIERAESFRDTMKEFQDRAPGEPLEELTPWGP